MSSAPASLSEAFGVCMGELGMFSAARLFLRELLREPDPDAVAEVVAAIGASYSVFDAVASRALATRTLPPVEPGPVVAALAGVSRVVVIGIESECLEAMLPLLRGVRVVIVPDLTLEADLGRVQANLGDSAELSDIDGFQRWAGRGAALLTTVYGADGFRATVCQAWLRAHGPDVRARFRSIIGWNVLGPKMDAYPRWLGETDAHEFAPLVGPGAGGG